MQNQNQLINRLIGMKPYASTAGNKSSPIRREIQERIRKNFLQWWLSFTGIPRCAAILPKQIIEDPEFHGVCTLRIFTRLAPKQKILQSLKVFLIFVLCCQNRIRLSSPSRKLQLSCNIRSISRQTSIGSSIICKEDLMPHVVVPLLISAYDRTQNLPVGVNIRR